MIVSLLLSILSGLIATYAALVGTCYAWHAWRHGEAIPPAYYRWLAIAVVAFVISRSF